MPWAVTTSGSVARDEHRPRRHHDEHAAWNDYAVRVFSLEMDGFVQDGDEEVVSGRAWSRAYARADQRVRIRLERAP